MRCRKGRGGGWEDLNGGLVGGLVRSGKAEHPGEEHYVNHSAEGDHHNILPHYHSFQLAAAAGEGGLGRRKKEEKGEKEGAAVTAGAAAGGGRGRRGRRGEGIVEQ